MFYLSIRNVAKMLHNTDKHIDGSLHAEKFIKMIMLLNITEERIIPVINI